MTLQEASDHPDAVAGAGRTLGALLDSLTTPVRPGYDGDIRVDAITARSEEVRPGSLFVAIPGSSADGHTFVADVARRGAAAILVERDVGGAVDTPLIRVGDVRVALAELAAAWHEYPGRHLSLLGITGTAGKTSTLSLLETLLLAGGASAGSIGSLGLHIQGEPDSRTVYTTPDPMLLHEGLAHLVREGSRVVAMEVTSHALVQARVHGLTFDLGIFTNLLPLEHSEFHEDFDDYARAKSLFFDLLEPDAPLLYNADDPATCGLVESRDLNSVAVGTRPSDTVRIRDPRIAADGTRLRLEVTRPIHTRSGTVEPHTLDIRLRLMGHSNVANAALASAAALCTGIDPDRIPDALAGFSPPKRRMEVVHRGRFTILDDTVGHPESISAVFRVVEALSPRRLHVVYAVRGQRGDRINRENGESLAVWAERLPVTTLVVTRSAGSADDLNRVETEEYEAFLEPLREHGVQVREIDRLESAVTAALEPAGDGDLVVLLGAQGMDRGQDLAREWLRSRTSPTG